VLPEAERREVVESWNATATAFPDDRCVHELIAAQAARTPEAVAVVLEAASLTYGALEARANQLAHHLRTLGVGPDVRVALCLERGLELVVALLAVLKAGGAYVPLDPSYPAERLRFMLEDSAPVVVLTQATLRSLVEGAGVAVLDVVAEAGGWETAPVTAPVVPGLGPAHLAYVIYTSGSTGRPKGVSNAHRGVVNRLVWMQQAYELAPGEGVLQKTPVSFDVSVWELFWPLLVGARVVLARPGGQQDPAYLVEAIARHRVTTVHFVPSMLQAFVAALPTESPGLSGACPGLRRLVCSGEALSAALVQRVQARLPHVALHNLYGPTEAAVDVTAWPCEPLAAGDDAASVPIGRPIANARLYVLNSAGQPAPVGGGGELYIGGVPVARGYLHRPGLTAERFVPDAFADAPGARLYRTGDLARWRADGVLEFLGRVDAQVKVRGFRIELGEIEARLAAHGAVRDVAVLARVEAPGDVGLVAYYVGEPAGDAAALRRWVAAALPDYMVPAAYVRLAALPLTPSGKLDRRALPAPDAAALATRGYEAPEGATEQALAALWAEVLRVERVGRHDDFFALGGHSLLVVTLVERMRRRGLHADVRALFTTPTLAAFATAVDDSPRGVDVPPNLIPAPEAGKSGPDSDEVEFYL
jgi:amino acid adenylation domain-containing protein